MGYVAYLTPPCWWTAAGQGLCTLFSSTLFGHPKTNEPPNITRTNNFMAIADPHSLALSDILFRQYRLATG